MTDLIKKIFDGELTEQGLEDLKARFPASVVLDLTDESVYQQARKDRTERNKLTAAINRRRIDTSSDLKDLGDTLIEKVINIFDVVVKPFEIAEQARADKAKADAEEKTKVINADKAKVAGFERFVTNARDDDSSSISSAIDAVKNIDCSVFHKDVIHEAITKQASVLAQLGEIMTAKLEAEAQDRENKELQAKLAKQEAERLEANAAAIKDAENNRITAHIGYIKSLPGDAMDLESKAEVGALIAALEQLPGGKLDFGERADEVHAATVASLARLVKIQDAFVDPETEDPATKINSECAVSTNEQLDNSPHIEPPTPEETNFPAAGNDYGLECSEEVSADIAAEHPIASWEGFNLECQGMAAKLGISVQHARDAVVYQFFADHILSDDEVNEAMLRAIALIESAQ